MCKNEKKTECRNIYRNSKLGESLALTLDNLVTNDRIPYTLAVRVLDQFDKSIFNALKHQTKARVKIKGRVEKYNHVQNVWLYHAKNVLMIVEVGTGLEKEIYRLDVEKVELTCVDEGIIKRKL